MQYKGFEVFLKILGHLSIVVVVDHCWILPPELPEIVISRRDPSYVLLVDPVIRQDVPVVVDELEAGILKLGELGVR